MSRLADIKNKNKQDILTILFTQPYSSKKKIGQSLKLSPSAMTKLCAELMDEGAIVETTDSFNTNKVGRKEIALTINSTYGHVIGITINHQGTHLLLTDLRKNVLDHIQISTDINTEIFLETLINSLKELIKRNTDISQILGFGISIKGRTDGLHSFSGIWNHTVSIVEPLQAAFNLPIIMDNGVRCSALQAQFETNLTDFTFIKYVEAGIGAALIEDGQIKTGQSHSIAEFGHMILDPTRDYCPVCKRKGCLESISSIENLLSTIKKNFSSHNYPILWELCNGDAKKINMKKINKAVEEGSIKINLIYQQYAENFAISLINYNTIVDRKHIFLSGEIFDSEQFQTFLKGRLVSLQLVPLWEQLTFYQTETEYLSSSVLAINEFFLKWKDKQS